MLGTNELMNSRVSGSEEALARLTCDKLCASARPTVLIGGLGMGFTLRATLAALGDDAKIIVAELVPAVIDWAHGPMAEIFGASLSDPRVSIQVTDVGRLIEARQDAYDAIMLDVDNGPEGLTRPANDGLYDDTGLHTARRALRLGGVLAVWSSGPDRSFARRLSRAGFQVEEVKARANGRRGGARHVIWLAGNGARAGKQTKKAG